MSGHLLLVALVALVAPASAQDPGCIYVDDFREFAPAVELGFPPSGERPVPSEVCGDVVMIPGQVMGGQREIVVEILADAFGSATDIISMQASAGSLELTTGAAVWGRGGIIWDGEGAGDTCNPSGTFDGDGFGDGGGGCGADMCGSAGPGELCCILFTATGSDQAYDFEVIVQDCLGNTHTTSQTVPSGAADTELQFCRHQYPGVDFGAVKNMALWVNAATYALDCTIGPVQVCPIPEPPTSAPTPSPYVPPVLGCCYQDYLSLLSLEPGVSRKLLGTPTLPPCMCQDDVTVEMCDDYFVPYEYCGGPTCCPEP